MEKIPTHLALILDGNGRWAQKRGMPRTFGHQEGAKTLEKISDVVRKKGVKYLTVFAFSSENWGRPKEEVSFLMKLFHRYLDSDVKRVMKEGVRLLFIGKRDHFSEDILKKMDALEEKTKNNSDFYMIFALGYGGKQEIVHAAQQIAQKAKDGKILPSEINEEMISDNLWSAKAHVPPVDLMIRTAGDVRISNFLLWQLAYAELFFTPTFWPDFSEEELSSILENFASRDRRFGKIKESKNE
ncbi:MAG: polyprenyl diphosphate synthase [Alphaproteobacteria bacterium]|nr:polyprenyl diphosphate synthase [Alphaproteobacteria bacterium]